MKNTTRNTSHCLAENVVNTKQEYTKLVYAQMFLNAYENISLGIQGFEAPCSLNVETCRTFVISEVGCNQIIAFFC